VDKTQETQNPNTSSHKGSTIIIISSNTPKNNYLCCDWFLVDSKMYSSRNNITG